jgi:hypothetical protein
MLVAPCGIKTLSGIARPLRPVAVRAPRGERAVVASDESTHEPERVDEGHGLHYHDDVAA